MSEGPGKKGGYSLYLNGYLNKAGFEKGTFFLSFRSAKTHFCMCSFSSLCFVYKLLVTPLHE